MSISKKLRFTILMRDGFSCKYCGKKSHESELHVDHIFPASKGGSDDPENLTTACLDCSSGKRDRILPEHDLTAFIDKAAEHWGCKKGFISCFVHDLFEEIIKFEITTAAEKIIRMARAMLDALAHEPLKLNDGEAPAQRLAQTCTIVKLLLRHHVYKEKNYPDALSYLQDWAADNKNQLAAGNLR